MQKLGQSKQIILFFTALFLVSSIYLFSIDSKYNSSKPEKDWWVVYFTDPKSDNLGFEIENFSSQKDFHWELLADKDKLSEGDVQINQGNKQEVLVNSDIADKKMSVRISNGQETKEIYKHKD